MPAKPPPRRGKVPQALFWGGMALAPLAVLILLFGQSAGALRAAVVLAVLTIVLLSISMAIRPSVDMVRVDIEHRVLDEMERMRLRTRDETSQVARHTAQALADRIHTLNATIEDLRAQVDEAQAMAYFEPGPPAIGAGPAAGPGLRRTETVHVTRRTTYDDTGTVYGSRAALERRHAVDGEWVEDDRDDDRSWTPGRPEPRALPAVRGEPSGQWVDDRHDDRDRDRDDRLDDRGYSRDRYERDRYDDRRDRGGYDRYDREPDRYDRDRGYERDRRYEPDRGYERERAGYDRHDDRDRRHDRERGHERGPERDRYDDRGRHDDRDRYDRSHAPRPRSPEW